MMHEQFLDDTGRLIPEREWIRFVDEQPRTVLESGEVLPGLQRLLVQAVESRIPGQQCAVLFSGGVDSTAIAFLLKKMAADFICITVGFQDGGSREPEDVVEAVKVARELGFRQEIVLLDLEGMDSLFRKTASILGPALTDVVNSGVGAVSLAGLERAKALNISTCFTGLGSEELFAGYDRHERALQAGGYQALRDECLAGLRGMHGRDLRRDCSIAASLGVETLTPFLDHELVSFSLRIPAEMKISATRTFEGRARGDVPVEKRYKKLVLREAAVALGMPERIAFRPKRAAQYGSRTNKALSALAKRHGFRFKEEYLQSILR